MNSPRRPSLRPPTGIAAPEASGENRPRLGEPAVRGAVLVDDAGLEFDWLFADEFPAVMRAVYLIVHDLDRAEDITQDAFVQLLRHWKRSRGTTVRGHGSGGSPSGWPWTRSAGSGSEPCWSVRLSHRTCGDRSTWT